MSDQPTSSTPDRLSPEDARIVIKAIEQVEKEEAAAQDRQRQKDANPEVA